MCIRDSNNRYDNKRNSRTAPHRLSGPVSYTHLDVYKRQIEVNEKDPNKFIEAVKAIAPTFGGINLEDIKAPECFEPVSYTHLDVYKRQAWNRREPTE